MGVVSGKDGWGRGASICPYRRTLECRTSLRAVLAGGKRAGLLCSCTYKSPVEGHSGETYDARYLRLSACEDGAD